MKRRIATAAATAAALLALPGSALAGDSSSVSGGVLTYVSGTGTVDVISLSASGKGKHVLTDWRSPSGAPGIGCAAAGVASAECSGATSASLSTLDGDDTVVVYAPLATAISGGDGADTLTGGPAADTIDAGAGDDTVEARDGRADRVDCGPGVDTAETDPVDVVVNCNDPLPAPVTPAGEPADPVDPGVEVPAGGDGTTPSGEKPVVGITPLPPLGALPVVVEVPAELSVGAAGVAGFDLACAPTEAAGCQGTVFIDPEPRTRSGKPRALAARRGRYGRSGFNVAAGKRTRLNVKLSASARRALGLPTGRKARMARRGRPVKAVVTVAPKGKKPTKSKVKLKP